MCLVFLATTLTLPAAVIFSEDFNASTNIPDGWTTEQLEEARPADRAWRCDNPGNISVGGNFTGNFAMYDGYYGGYVTSPNVRAILTTPVIDCSGHESITLAYDVYYYHYSSNYKAAEVLISTDGETWTRLK
ncbi:MAG: choice-of-anchor J domain-containing protein, partial [Candidatus Cloacimonetes bacterium]|nr:choice-of-anchor J domain-containing protein [Candidatus Cloacimonadota bacterium]